MSAALAARAESVRAFNRFYTQKIGLLRADYFEAPYPLPLMRVIFELGRHGEAIAADLARDLALDQGYLSRLVKRLRRDGLVAAAPSTEDRRQQRLTLSERGLEVFAAADRRSAADVMTLLETMPEPDQQRLVAKLEGAGRLLGSRDTAAGPVVILREHRPGDMGWIVEANAVVYARDYGFDGRFEATVAEVVAAFLRDYNPARERWWIAERDGERVGCVAIARASDEVAKLRMLLVEPAARGLGLGRTLVRECIRFAREAGYRTLTLWTVDILAGARHIYESEGFRIVATEPFNGFGPSITSETWELAL